ncbi:MAG: penicillin-binding protein 1C [Caldilineae bacterium]|nr:MAG: penicillin-binding protein 1C [Caldilineae bacterium]
MSSSNRRPTEQSSSPHQPADPASQDFTPSRQAVDPEITRWVRPLSEEQKIAHTRPEPVGTSAASPPQVGVLPSLTMARWLRKVGRGLFWMTLFGTILFLLLTAMGIVSYVYLAANLPSAKTLKARQLNFQTTLLFDSQGNRLSEINNPDFGRRLYVPLERISPYLIDATIATEDRSFFVNTGVDPIAIVRAVYYNVTTGSIVAGGSTITQQLARSVFLSPQERTAQSLKRKVKEAVLAMELTRTYAKTDILEIYLNQIYYGNLAYGIEAASQTYFGKSAANLSLAEAAFLAGLPQGPALYNPYTNPQAALRRQKQVLRLMVEAGYITNQEAQDAMQQPLLQELKTQSSMWKAPHFVNYVRQQLERRYPGDLIYKAGLQVKTTLDPHLQTIAEEEIARQMRILAPYHASDAALVAIEVKTGRIVAMVGSRDFQNEAIAGQINMALVPRQVGSTIKPFLYLVAFEKGWTPATLLLDTPVEYPDGKGGLYRPTNFDHRFHGLVTVREALRNSYNVPAVKTLSEWGVDSLKGMAKRLGITTFTRDDYGLSLALGSGEASLLEMTAAYQVLANGGVRIPPYAITQVLDAGGEEIFQSPQAALQVVRPAHAYLITAILSSADPHSNLSALSLSRPAAFKTGTTNDFRDSWVIGYTPDLVVGVWVGNADYSPMENVTGLVGAGPIWQRFMERAHIGLPAQEFPRPEDVVEIEICADSGTRPSDACPQTRTEFFAADQPPLDASHDVHQFIAIDRNTGKRANRFCASNVITRYFRVYPPEGRTWAIEHGIPQPPQYTCTDFVP